ncbi:MAG: hypothetical protein VB055_07910 [Oscillospiraceae bacterium]|nr:hypothetical protein [Oscillospiraceae bacterium]
MELILGGAYQGKRDYAIQNFGLTEGDICTCTADCLPDRSARCLDRLEEYVLCCVRQGVAPDPDFREDAILIGRDIFCGVVPIDPEIRLWREETGRFFARLSARADHVTRLFCGLPQALK